MRVVFDSVVFALAARTGNRSGVYRYASELIQAFKQMPDIELKFACSDVWQSPWACYDLASLRSSYKSYINSWSHYFVSHKAVQSEDCIIDARKAVGSSVFARQLKALLSQERPRLLDSTSAVSFRIKMGLQNEPSIIHLPFHLVPSALQHIKNAKIVRTIHDVLPLSMPQFFLDKAVRRFRDAIEHISPEENIICVSNAVRNDLLRYKPNINPEQVHVTPLGANIKQSYMGDDEDWQMFLNHFGIRSDERLILALGTLEPRKNLITLIRAIEHLSTQRDDLRIRLLVVGRTGWNFAQILTRIKSSSCRSQILVLGGLPDALVNCLYQRCDVSVFVSWGEGFGLPVLESMRLGTPVIASRIPVLQEIGGNAAIYVDPASSNEIAQAIGTVLDNNELRNHHRSLGLLRAGQYSWLKTAGATRLCYKQIIEH